MIKNFASFMFIVLFFSFPLAAQDERKANEAIIRQILADYITAFNEHDSKKMIAFWTEDGDLINTWGQLALNRADVEKLFIENNEGILKNARVTESIKYLRFITLDVALVDAERVFFMKNDQGKDLPPFTNYAFYVMLRKNGRWQISSFRAYSLREVGIAS